MRVGFTNPWWVVVGAVWTTLAIASGLYFSFPIFYVALLEDFGWSRGATALAFSISSVVQGLLSPVVGMLVDRLGPHRVMLAGAVVLGVACALSSRIGSLWSTSPVLLARWVRSPTASSTRGPAGWRWRSRKWASDRASGWPSSARTRPSS